MAIQGITMSEQRYPKYLKSVDFIQRYIFPGGCLITPKSVLDSVARTTDMRLLHVEDLAPHYGRTVRLWHERFFDQIEQVRLQGFPETFIRLWDFYLSYCEAALHERRAAALCLTDGYGNASLVVVNRSSAVVPTSLIPRIAATRIRLSINRYSTIA
jgi:cyclopropane-fatty-acyl-phospholipid synthase